MDMNNPPFSIIPPQIQILDCININNVNDLNSALAKSKNIIKTGTVLIPLLRNKQWLSIILEFQDNNLTNALYLDSFNMDETIVDSKISKQFDVIYPNKKLSIACCIQQNIDISQDFVSSGAYIIENILITSLKLCLPKNEPSAIEIRAMHIQSLRNNNPEYAYGFEFRQRHNTNQENDEAMTVVLLKRLSDSLLKKESSAFKNKDVRNFYRESYQITINQNRKKELTLKNSNKINSIDGIVLIKENEYKALIAQELRLALWNIKAEAKLNTQYITSTAMFAALGTVAFEANSTIFGAAGPQPASVC